MIRDWWISIRFVCFVFQGSLFCDRPVLGNNRLVKFASQIILIFLILVTCKSKATSASYLRHKIYSPSRFPSLFLNSLESFSAKLGARYIVICINPAFTKMIDRTEKPKIPSKFAKRAARYNEFRCNSFCLQYDDWIILKNREDYPRNCFRIKEKDTQIKM